MSTDEFISLIGEDITVLFPCGDEIQKWNMKYFSFDNDGNIKHPNIEPLIMDFFISKCYLAVDDSNLVNELFELNLICKECDFDSDSCSTCCYGSRLCELRSLLTI